MNLRSRAISNLTKLAQYATKFQVMSVFEFATFLRDHQVFEAIFTQNPQPDLISRSTELLALHISSGLGGVDRLINAIGASCRHSDLEVRRVTYKIVLDLVQTTEIKVIKDISLVVKVCCDNPDLHFVKFLQDYTTRVIQRLTALEIQCDDYIDATCFFSICESA